MLAAIQVRPRSGAFQKSGDCGRDVRRRSEVVLEVSANHNAFRGRAEFQVPIAVAFGLNQDSIRPGKNGFHQAAYTPIAGNARSEMRALTIARRRRYAWLPDTEMGHISVSRTTNKRGP